MKTKFTSSLILLIINIIIFIVLSVISYFCLFQWTFGSKTEGSGILIIPIIIVDVISIIISFILNTLSLLLLGRTSDKNTTAYKAIKIAAIIMFFVPIISFVIKLMFF